MIKNCVDRGFVAVHDIEDAGGEACFLEEFPRQHDGGWIAFGRFEDESVAACDSDGIHPHRHHGWEVKWRDARDNA